MESFHSRSYIDIKSQGQNPFLSSLLIRSFYLRAVQISHKIYHYPLELVHHELWKNKTLGCKNARDQTCGPASELLSHFLQTWCGACKGTRLHTQLGVFVVTIAAVPRGTHRGHDVVLRGRAQVLKSFPAQRELGNLASKLRTGKWTPPYISPQGRHFPHLISD